MATRRRWLQFSLVGVFVAAFPVLLVVGVQNALRNADESFRRDFLLRQQQWLAEQKQALTTGDISSVCFYSTSDTDRLVGELAGMPEIKGLTFHLTDLTDGGCETIAELPNISSLTLYGGRLRVGDAGLATLSRNGSLETLQLVNIDVTDDGLDALRSFPRLKELTIFWEAFRGRLLTDKAVKNLSRLQNLGKLNISGGWMSNAAFAKLKESLPNCFVVKTKSWEGD